MDDWGLPLEYLLALGGLLAVTGLLFAVQKRFRRIYVEQAQQFSQSKLTGRQACEKLLADNGLANVPVADGAKQDQYDWRKGRVWLRLETAVSSSRAAFAIAAHEVGHAQQFAQGFWAARLVPAVWWTSCAVVVFAFLAVGYSFLVEPLASLSVILAVSCGIVILFRIPVCIALEMDANRRARTLTANCPLSDVEKSQIARLLRAGFGTHASLALQQACYLAFVPIWPQRTTLRIFEFGKIEV